MPTILPRTRHNGAVAPLQLTLERGIVWVKDPIFPNLVARVHPPKRGSDSPQVKIGCAQRSVRTWGRTGAWTIRQQLGWIISRKLCAGRERIARDLTRLMERARDRGWGQYTFDIRTAEDATLYLESQLAHVLGLAVTIYPPKQ